MDKKLKARSNTCLMLVQQRIQEHDAASYMEVVMADSLADSASNVIPRHRALYPSYF